MVQAQALNLQPLRDEALREALLGHWCAPQHAASGCWAVDVLDAQGRLLACGRRPDDGEPFYGRGRFEVQGERLCYRVEEASDSFWIRPGSRFCVRIVGVSPSRHVYEDVDNRSRHGLLRLQPAQIEQALREHCPLRP